MQNLGIIGRARVGKDTAGAWFGQEHGYQRVGFADALKRAALRADPIVDVDSCGDSYRLSGEVNGYGWDYVKAQTDGRRFLQELGMAIRALDPDFWIRVALKTVAEANESGKPAVITDVRFPNEVDSLKRAGFKLLHIDRPDIPQLDHASEGAVGPEDAHYLVRNDGTLDDLHSDLAVIWEEIDGLNRARRLMFR